MPAVDSVPVNPGPAQARKESCSSMYQKWAVTNKINAFLLTLVKESYPGFVFKTLYIYF